MSGPITPSQPTPPAGLPPRAESMFTVNSAGATFPAKLPTAVPASEASATAMPQHSMPRVSPLHALEGIAGGGNEGVFGSNSSSGGAEHLRMSERMPLEFEPIFNKALTGGYKEVGEIIDAGAPIDATDENGNTALHAACQGGSLKTVKACLRRAYETNVQNRHGNTPLHYAYAFGHQDVAEYLVRKGNASQEVRNIYGLCACEGLGQEDKERPGLKMFVASKRMKHLLPSKFS